jgi:hypothetical protein
MKHIRMILAAAAALTTTFAIAGPSEDIARGNMHFDAAAADTNGDHMISKDEFMKYGELMWEHMARSASVSIPIADAAGDFARGNIRFDAKAMDSDGDGKISKDEFMKYAEGKFNAMKKDSGMISVADASRNIGRGNMHLESK